MTVSLLHKAEAENMASRKNALRILVADDNTDAAEMLAALLQINGHITEIANDGNSAYRIATQLVPDVAILDIGMPGLNGYEVAQLMKNSPITQATLLIALTGWGAEHDQLRAKEAGFDFHLTKPTELSTIENLIAQIK